jgi:hypothetical protein
LKWSYQFEPFGVRINALDIGRKIQSGHNRHILSLAYVAAMRIGKCVSKVSLPHDNREGVAKVYNGQIMSEAEADQTGKPKWFWIMNVARRLAMAQIHHERVQSSTR